MNIFQTWGLRCCRTQYGGVSNHQPVLCGLNIQRIASEHDVADSYHTVKDVTNLSEVPATAEQRSRPQVAPNFYNASSMRWF